MPQLSFIDAGIFTEKELFSIEQWQRLGHQLYKERKESGDTKNTHETDEGRQLWAIGDWLLYGERLGKMGERKLKWNALALFRGYAWPTLKAHKVVSKAIPEHRRRYHLSYSIHSEVASLEEPMQEQILDWVETRQKEIDQANALLRSHGHPNPKIKGPVSVRHVRQEVKKHSKKKKSSGEVDKASSKKLTIWLKDENYKFILDIGTLYEQTLPPGFVGRPEERAAHLVVDILFSYFARHKEEIKPKLAAYRAGDHKTRSRLPELLYDRKPTTKAPEPATPEVPETVEVK